MDVHGSRKIYAYPAVTVWSSAREMQFMILEGLSDVEKNRRVFFGFLTL
jgi:hypothetical protein